MQYGTFYRFWFHLFFLFLLQFCFVRTSQAQVIETGMYGLWASKDMDATLTVLSTSKFTLVSGVGSKYALDRAYVHGIKCLIGYQTGLTKEIATDEVQWQNYLKGLQVQIMALKDHPALYAWYLVDEPDWKQIPISRIRDLRNFVKSLDPKHPMYTVLGVSNRNYNAYLPFFDIVAVAPYFKKNATGTEATPDIVTNYIAKARKDIRKLKLKKPLWVVLGAFEERPRSSAFVSSFRKPTPEEFRRMVELARQAGVDGIMVWTLAFTGDSRYYDWNLPIDDPLLWEIVKQVPSL